MKTVKVEMELVLTNDSGTAWIADTIYNPLNIDAGEELKYCKVTVIDEEAA